MVLLEILSSPVSAYIMGMTTRANCGRFWELLYPREIC